MIASFHPTVNGQLGVVTEYARVLLVDESMSPPLAVVTGLHRLRRLYANGRHAFRRAFILAHPTPDAAVVVDNGALQEVCSTVSIARDHLFECDRLLG
jgi:hypothetical protein